MTDSPSATISAKELHELLGGPAEFALIDVREPDAPRLEAAHRERDGVMRAAVHPAHLESLLRPSN